MFLFLIIASCAGIPLESMQGLASQTNEYSKSAAEVIKRKDTEDPLWNGKYRVQDIKILCQLRVWSPYR